MTSIPDTQLGLSPSEIHLFRQHQAIALAAPPSLTSSTRGRSSSSRASSSRNSSSRAHGSTSRHAAAGNGILHLDTSSLSVLASHFDHLMSSIGSRIDYLSQLTEESTQRQAAGVARTIREADREIDRMRELLGQIDELEVEFDKVRRIRDIVKGFRGRVEGLERRIRR
ncbi:hypothetical protein MMC09_001055 [Bachmanniomyces sp. S44760]|nr:hypothetical protein [Bachmanniomyces sp. S44760]